MLEWSLEAFAGSEAVATVVVAAPPSHSAEVRQVGPQSGSAALTVVEGGATRAESVSKALALVETEVVAIHDAARPLLTSALIEALVADLDANSEAAAVIAAAPMVDTIKRARSSDALATDRGANASLVVGETMDRAELWGAQTPQVFRTGALRAALEIDEATRDAATDEAMLVEQAGGVVLLHDCREPNLKVTTPHDLRVAEMLLRDRSGSAR
jgi:2-C-methyl-D-erythritol 4-phosphate cytidylyltransferase